MTVHVTTTARREVLAADDMAMLYLKTPGPIVGLAEAVLGFREIVAGPPWESVELSGPEAVEVDGGVFVQLDMKWLENPQRKQVLDSFATYLEDHVAADMTITVAPRPLWRQDGHYGDEFTSIFLSCVPEEYPDMNAPDLHPERFRSLIDWLIDRIDVAKLLVDVGGCGFRCSGDDLPRLAKSVQRQTGDNYMRIGIEHDDHATMIGWNACDKGVAVSFSSHEPAASWLNDRGAELIMLAQSISNVSYASIQILPVYNYNTMVIQQFGPNSQLVQTVPVGALDRYVGVSAPWQRLGRGHLDQLGGALPPGAVDTGDNMWEFSSGTFADWGQIEDAYQGATGARRQLRDRQCYRETFGALRPLLCFNEAESDLAHHHDSARWLKTMHDKGELLDRLRVPWDPPSSDGLFQ